MHLDALWTILNASIPGHRERTIRAPSIPQDLLFQVCKQALFLRKICSDATWTSRPQFHELADKLLDEMSKTAVLLYSFSQEFHGE